MTCTDGSDAARLDGLAWVPVQHARSGVATVHLEDRRHDLAGDKTCSSDSTF
jgi:hypothetical protein